MHAIRGVLLSLVCAVTSAAQWEPAPTFSLAHSPIAITERAQPHMPFTVAGEHGAVFGQQDGSFEMWSFPNKIASHFRITAELESYPIPIELSDYAAAIEVNPERTTITYSHAAFTVRQHMFSGRGAASGTGAFVFFEISAVRPLALTVRFTPDMLRMWPAPNYGLPSAEWVTAGPSGYYLLHTDNERFSAAIGMPGSTPGIMAPYQERPRTYPLEFKLRFDPKTQAQQFFPLIMAATADQLLQRSREWPNYYRQTADYYAHFFDTRLTVTTPDPRFDRALRWAELAIDQAQVAYHDETGLVAGYYSSADSARPGFGWFFGRDTLFTLYAVNSYGDFALSRRTLEFLFKRQRADGKIMHEFSQSADLVDWPATPYFYAAADATPLLVMTMLDYVRASGDITFLQMHWAAVKKAYAFTRAHDSDGDGFYENTEGTGWVESWPPKMPHQEVYLAALDLQSSLAMQSLAKLMNETSAPLPAAKLASEYFDTTRQFYAFSRNADASLDRTASIFPAVAWWNGTTSLPNASAMLTRWASNEFSTDWGVRDISRTEAIYDPMSYHQGTVWPLYTGWVSLAEYRAGRPLSGFAHLMQNVEQTYTQDAGAVTELLSGEYFQPLGRSSSHQLWSSAMVLTPAIRGLFGIDTDLTLHPQLPASWDSAELHNVYAHGKRYDITFRRTGNKLVADVAGRKQEFALPTVEIEPPHALPEPGAPTRQPKVISQSYEPRAATFEIDGQGSETAEFFLRLNRRNLQLTGATMKGNRLTVKFPDGPGYQHRTVRFSW